MKLIKSAFLILAVLIMTAAFVSCENAINYGDKETTSSLAATEDPVTSDDMATETAETTTTTTTTIATTTATTTTTTTTTTTETTTATEPVPVIVPAAALNTDDIKKHALIPLYGDNGIPYYNEKAPQTPYIQAYLSRSTDYCVVIFPGGGYFKLTESEASDIALAYNNMGISAFVVRYRIGNTAGVSYYDGEAFLCDGQRAVQFVRYYAEQLGINPNRIAVCGFSAGGHLAMEVCQHPASENTVHDEIGECSSSPDLCILGYAVTRLDGTSTTPKIFLGENFGIKEYIDKYSYWYAPEKMPPSFIFYSKKDGTVNPVTNSEELAAKLKELGTKVQCVGYKDGGHGSGLGALGSDFSSWLRASIKFMKETLTD